MRFSYLRELLWIVCIALLVALVWWLANLEAPAEDLVESATAHNQADWLLYQSTEYGISFAYPQDWQVLESTSPVPIITVRPQRASDEVIATIQENAAHLSFYPRGLPGQLIFGEKRPVSVPLTGLGAYHAEAYLLANNTPWSYRLSLQQLPANWTPANLIYARARIDGEVTWCEKNGAVIADNDCDPLFGYVFRRDGGVATSERDLLLQMLATLSFVTSADVTADLRIDRPLPFTRISSPVVVSGSVPNSWLFEDMLSISLYDNTGELLSDTLLPIDTTAGAATSSFSTQIRFSRPQSSGGYLLFRENTITQQQTSQEFRVDVTF